MQVTSSRVSRSCIQPAGAPAASEAAAMTSARMRLVPAASLPPLRSTALPLFRQRLEICTRASGRDSKITPMTPIGQLTL